MDRAESRLAGGRAKERAGFSRQGPPLNSVAAPPFSVALRHHSRLRSIIRAACDRSRSRTKGKEHLKEANKRRRGTRAQSGDASFRVEVSSSSIPPRTRALSSLYFKSASSASAALEHSTPLPSRADPCSCRIDGTSRSKERRRERGRELSRGRGCRRRNDRAHPPKGKGKNREPQPGRLSSASLSVTPFSIPLSPASRWGPEQSLRAPRARPGFWGGDHACPWASALAHRRRRRRRRRRPSPSPD